MSEKPKQASFFIQDPFTEEVQGPLSVQELKEWFSKGAVEGWGVSKSPNGPWTPATQVKGLAPAKPPEPAAVISEAPAPKPVTEQPSASDSPPSVGASLEPLRENVAAVVGLAKQYFPQSLIGRVLVSIVGLWLACAVLFGIGVLWSDTFGQGARARAAMAEAKAQGHRTEEALRQSGEAAHRAMEQLQGNAYKEKVIRDAEYERAKQQLAK